MCRKIFTEIYQIIILGLKEWVNFLEFIITSLCSYTRKINKYFNSITNGYIVLILLFIFIVVFPVCLGMVINNLNNGELGTIELWMSFYGSYGGGILGGIATLIAVYATTKQTRAIESQIIQREEDEKLKKMRTVIEIIQVECSWGLKEYRKMLYGNKLIQTAEYRKLGKISDVVELSMDKKTELAKYDDYPFIIIRNIGDNPMFKINVKLEGYEKNNVLNRMIFEFNEYCINKGGCLVYPVFKLNKEYDICSMAIEKVIVDYTTDLIGKNEIITHIEKYGDIDDDNETRSIEVTSREDNSKGFIYKNKEQRFSYILLEPEEYSTKGS